MLAITLSLSLAVSLYAQKEDSAHRLSYITPQRLQALRAIICENQPRLCARNKAGAMICGLPRDLAKKMLRIRRPSRRAGSIQISHTIDHFKRNEFPLVKAHKPGK